MMLRAPFASFRRMHTLAPRIVWLGSVALLGCGATPPTDPHSKTDGPKIEDGVGPNPDLLEAQAALEKKDCKLAKAKAESALAREPKDSKDGGPEFILGACAEMDKKDDEAFKFYRAALAKEPGMLAATTNLSAILIEKKDFDEAVAILEAAILKNKKPLDQADLHTNLGYAFQGKGLHDRAAKAFGQAAKTKPDDASLRNAWADELLAAGEKEAAAREYKNFAAKTTGRDEHRLAAIGLAKSGDAVGCTSLLDKLIDRPAVDSPLHDLLFERAVCRHASSDLKGARADIAASIAKKPTIRAHQAGAKFAVEAKDAADCKKHWGEVKKLAGGKPEADEKIKKGIESCTAK